jgi:hypothetical protein
MQKPDQHPRWSADYLSGLLYGVTALDPRAYALACGRFDCSRRDRV